MSGSTHAGGFVLTSTDEQIAAYHDHQVEEEDWEEAYRRFMATSGVLGVVGCEERYYADGTNWADVSTVRQCDTMAGLDWDRPLSPLTDVEDDHEVW